MPIPEHNDGDPVSSGAGSSASAASATPVPGEQLFSGAHPVTLDQKFRVTVPARWRSQGLTELFIMKGPERSLLAMPGDVLHSWGEETSAKADGSREQNKRTEAIFTSAVECPIDGQGRMVLPPLLREHAGITKEVCLTGLNNKIRIWNTDAWNEREAKLAAAREEILAELVW